MSEVLEKRLEETQKELEHLRESLRRKKEKVEERLRDCEGVLRFYSIVSNYGVSPKDASGFTHQNAIKDDYDPALNDSKTFIAGRRAREYFDKYAKE